MPTKFLWRGDGFTAADASGWAAVGHFDGQGVFKVSTDGSTVKTLPLADVQAVSGATHTLTPADNGKTIIGTGAAGLVVTLPAASYGKMKFTLSLGVDVTSNNFDVATAATDTIIGNRLTGSTGKGVRCANASDAAGDFVEVVSDGTTTWYIAAIKGTWIQIP